MRVYSVNARFLLLSVFVVLGLRNGFGDEETFFQNPNWSQSRLELEVEKIMNPTRILYVAAHPDDENTRLISWLVNNLHADVAYLSMTKGSGGQNLIGEELGEDLGLIREQELLAARRIDGGTQFFTSAIDFGYSKSHEETFEKWGKEQILKEVVYCIRKFKPHVIITRFSPETEGLRSTHGHHTASAIVALEAFKLSSDPNAYPEQLAEVDVWSATGIYWNTSYWSYGSEEKLDSVVSANPTQFVKLNVEAYVPGMGMSTSEIAAASRSMHKSQGFGTMARYGQQYEYLQLLEGEPAYSYLQPKYPKYTKEDLALFKLIDEAGNFNQITYPDWLASKVKSREISAQQAKSLEKLFLLSGGLRLMFIADSDKLIAGSNKLKLEMLHFHQFSNLIIDSVHYKGTQVLGQEKFTSGIYHSFELELTLEDHYQVPSIDIWIKGSHFKLPLYYRHSDPVKGELLDPVIVVPPVEIEFETTDLVILNSEDARIEASLSVLKDLKDPILVQSFDEKGVIEFIGEYKDLKAGNKFALKLSTSSRQLSLLVTYAGGEVRHLLREIRHEHIPLIRKISLARVNIHYIKVSTDAKSVAYVMGAGDKVHDAIAQLGVEVTIIDPFKIGIEELMEYDAVVFGIRAMNTLQGIESVLPLFHSYAHKGGNLIFQYNTSHRLQTENFMPAGYDISLSRDRVTEEDSKVSFDTKDPVMLYPNIITAKSWDNWIQERGLYFPSEWPEVYRSPLSMADRNSEELKGALLIAEYGEGHIVYTGISFFRELPAGVEGAYQLWANILSL